MEKNKIISFLQDDQFVKDLKSIIIFFLAFLIAFVTNGLVDEFRPDLIWSGTVLLSTIGLYFGIVLVMNEMSTRGYQDKVDTLDELQDIRLKIKEKGRELNHEKAKVVLKNYNTQKVLELQNIAKEKAIQKHQDYIDRFKDRIHAYTLIRLKFYHIFRKIKRWRFTKKITKRERKIDKIKKYGVYVKYDYIEFDDLKYSDISRQTKEVSERAKLNDNPIKITNRKMAASNFVKIFIFTGLQGAIYAGITSIWEFLFYLLVVTLTLLTTALLAYTMTSKYTENVHVGRLHDKHDLLCYIVDNQKGVDSLSESSKGVEVDYDAAFARDEIF